MPNLHQVQNSSAGKLHLLDLADIKSQMGERWARMADPVDRFFEGAVRRNLKPGDTFVRQGELSYILLFRDLSPEEAQVKCRTISEELCERLFGDQIHRASVRTLVVPLSRDAFAGDAISEALNELLERKGRELIVQVTAAKSEVAPVAQQTAGVPADELTFEYQPIWDATKNIVITYLCKNMDRADNGVTGANGEVLRHEDRQAAIDRSVLRECAARTRQLHSGGLRILCGVSVAIDTISHSRLWASYSKDVQAIAPLISRDFAFFITGIDSGVPNIRLAQEIPKLTRFSRQIFCLINDRGYVGSRFARTGTHAIGIALSPGEVEAVSMSRIIELAQQAADARLAAFVLGIPSSSIMLHALGQGIRYLQGEIIRPAISDPRHAFAQSLEYVYTSGNYKTPVGKSGAA